MVRTLKYHEAKLLKRTDFLNWKRDNVLRKSRILLRFHIHDEAEYDGYNKVVLLIRKLAAQLKKLPKDDAFRLALTKRLSDRLLGRRRLTRSYDLGVINLPEKGLTIWDHLNASGFCARRLAVVMAKTKMTQTIPMAERFIQQGRPRGD